MFLTRAFFYYSNIRGRGIAIQQRACALSQLVSYLPKSLLPEALEIVRSIEHQSYQATESYRAYALSQLVPYMSKYLLLDALEIARGIQNASDRAYALSQFVPYLTETYQKHSLLLLLKDYKHLDVL